MADLPTEKPTPRRLREAWRRGQFPRTRDAATACAFGALAASLPSVASDIRGAFERTFAQTVRAVEADDFAAPEAALRAAAQGAFSALAPWLLLLCALVVIVGAFQSRFFFGAGAIGRGFEAKRTLLSPVEAAKFVARAGVAFAVSYGALRSELPSLFRTSSAPVARSFDLATLWLVQLSARLLAAFAVVAVLDYLIERARHLGALRMTRDELRREEREEKGDPHIKRTRRHAAISEARR